MRTPAKSTIPFSPPIRNKSPNVTSESHSHANQGAPGFENENRSCVGTLWFRRMYSPVRMCQPVSPSISSDFQPLAPHTKSQVRMATKKQSENDGTSTRVQRPHLADSTPEESGASCGSTCTGASE